jgi:hypothetical protein
MRGQVIAENMLIWLTLSALGVAGTWGLGVGIGSLFCLT